MAHFKAMWAELDTSPEVQVFTFTEDLPGKAEAIQFYQDLLSDKNRSGALPRDDYRYSTVNHPLGSAVLASIGHKSLKKRAFPRIWVLNPNKVRFIAYELGPSYLPSAKT